VSEAPPSSSYGVPSKSSLEDLKPVRPPSELSEANKGQASRRWPLCCGCLVALLVLLSLGLGWLWVAAHPSHAGNGARVLSVEPEELEDDNYISLSLRYREGKLQSISSLGHLWEEDAQGVLRPAFGLTEPGVYFWPISVQGEWAGLPAGEQLYARNLSTGELDSIALGDTEKVMLSTTATRGSLLATASEIDGNVRVFRIKEGQQLWSSAVWPSNTVCMTFVGEALAVGTDRGKVELLKAQTGEGIRSLETGHRRVTALAASVDGELLLVGCILGQKGKAKAGGEVQLWDLTTSAASPSATFVIDNVFDEVSALAISPDGAYLAAGRTKGGLQVWDRSGALIGSFLHDDSLLFPKREVLAIAFDTDRVAWAAGVQVFERKLGQ